MIEVHTSLDGNKFDKLELTKNESILMKYIYKDSTDLSKIFSPYSKSFTFSGSLHNQKALGFIGKTDVLKTKTNSKFDCKIYINGLLSRTGLLNVTNVKYKEGRVSSYTGNFTTSLQSLGERMGDDLINDLADTPAEVNWVPDTVYTGLRKKANLPINNPMVGVEPKWYVPLISNNRVFQYNPDLEDLETLDNVAYNEFADPNGNNCLKADELSPAIQGRSIIDMIKLKYGLNVVMPLEGTPFYNDWYIYCNGENRTNKELVEFDLIEPFENTRSVIIGDVVNNTFEVIKSIYKNFKFSITLNDVITVSGSDVSVDFVMELESGFIYEQKSVGLNSNGDAVVKFTIQNDSFVNGKLKFKIKLKSSNLITWSSSDCRFDFSFDTGVFGVVLKYNSRSNGNDNSDSMSLSKIDLYQSIPETKCKEFLLSFFKTFNISVFESSPTEDKLYWLTPADIKLENKEYSSKEVDYTDYLESLDVEKKVPNEYNYYNFKHKTSSYKSSVDYESTFGIEYGQLKYPENIPTTNLNEFKVETDFSLLIEVPIVGMNNVKTSYAFTNDTPEVLETGETRYTPNTEDLTIFFAGDQKSLSGQGIGFQRIQSNGLLGVSDILAYIPTSPISTEDFTFSFSRIVSYLNGALILPISLYDSYYKEQTERLLDPNTLEHKLKLKLPPSELVLNFSNDTQGESNVPKGFRLQNDIIVQEQKYSIVEATIDQTNGETTITLLNY